MQVIVYATGLGTPVLRDPPAEVPSPERDSLVGLQLGTGKKGVVLILSHAQVADLYNEITSAIMAARGGGNGATAD